MRHKYNKNEHEEDDIHDDNNPNEPTHKQRLQNIKKIKSKIDQHISKMEMIKGDKIDYNHLASAQALTPFMKAQKHINEGRKLHSTKEIKKIVQLNQLKKTSIELPDWIYSDSNKDFQKLRELKLCDVLLEVKALNIKLNITSVEAVMN